MPGYPCIRISDFPDTTYLDTTYNHINKRDIRNDRNISTQSRKNPMHLLEWRHQWAIIFKPMKIIDIKGHHAAQG